MKTLAKRIAVIFAFFISLPAIGFSAVLFVPEEYGTIQAAITSANDGDIVLVADGVDVERLISAVLENRQS